MQMWAAITFLVTRLFFYYPCEHPVAYKVGDIDPRFKLSQSEALKDITAATGIWGQQYFELDPLAELTVNFVYDERQGLVTEINSQQGKIDSDEDSLAIKISAFNAKARELEQQIDDLNTEINKWNRQGGAPEDTYKELIARQQQLQAQIQSLQREGSEINQAARQFNLQVDELNGTINTFNTLIFERPEEGLYNGPEHRIDIYFVNTHNELVHTLAHEFGHALGMDHVENTKSIMYTFTSETVKPTPDDLMEFTRACTRVSKFKILSQLLDKQLRGNID